MTQEQMAKRVTGIVVAATLFLVVLFSVLVYQWIKIGVNQSRINKAEAEYSALMDETNEAKEDLDEIMNDPVWKYDQFIKYENQD